MSSLSYLSTIFIKRKERDENLFQTDCKLILDSNSFKNCSSLNLIVHRHLDELMEIRQF